MDTLEIHKRNTIILKGLKVGRGTFPIDLRALLWLRTLTRYSCLSELSKSQKNKRLKKKRPSISIYNILASDLMFSIFSQLVFISYLLQAILSLHYFPKDNSPIRRIQNYHARTKFTTTVVSSSQL